jgi:hypothetical protein
VLKDLKKRKLIKLQKVINFRAHKGPKFALEIAKEETDLTAEMLESYVSMFNLPHSLLIVIVVHGSRLLSSSTTSRLLELTSTPERCTL